MLDISSVPLGPAAGLGVGRWKGGVHVQQIKKAAAGMSAESPQDETAPVPLPALTRRSPANPPVCIPHAASGSGEGPPKAPRGRLII